jgi:hypothetical protein
VNPNVPDDSSPRYEVTIWRGRPFLIGAVCFFAFMGIVLAVVEPFKSPAADAGWNTDGPQLQTDAAGDLQILRQNEYKHLHTTAWADDSHTYAIVPIEQAMALLANAEANHQTNQLLPPTRPMTPIDLQNQKSGEAAPPAKGP